MPRTPLARKVIPFSTASALLQQPAKPLTETEAAKQMWLYYKNNKSQLVGNISTYRQEILAKLMVGNIVEQVFAPFAKPLEPTKPMRRAA